MLVAGVAAGQVAVRREEKKGEISPARPASSPAEVTQENDSYFLRHVVLTGRCRDMR